MSKKSLEVVLVNIKGIPLTGPSKEGPDGKATPGDPLAYKDLLINCLFQEPEPPSRLGWEEKAKRYRLAQRIEEATTEVELASEEITLLKTLCAEAWPTIVSGQITVALET